MNNVTFFLKATSYKQALSFLQPEDGLLLFDLLFFSASIHIAFHILDCHVDMNMTQ